MDAVADHCGLDRAVVRLANMIQPDEMPYDQGLMFQDGRPLIYDTGDFPLSLRKALDLVDWNGFAAVRDAARAEGRRVGIGLAAYVEGTGVGPYEGAHVRVETTGDVVVSTGLTTQGQGHETVFAQIAAQELGVPLDRVTRDDRRHPALRVRRGHVRLPGRGDERQRGRRRRPEGAGQGADDRGRGAGRLRVRTVHCTTVMSWSAGSPRADPGSPWPRWRCWPTRCGTRSTRRPSGPPSSPPRPGTDRRCRRATEPGLEATGWYSPIRSTFANGVHAAVVETDPETAEITVLRYCVVHDCGTVINPMIVEGQVHGGVAQGVGGALYERIVYDESGQLVNASFMDFLMPYASEVPRIETDHVTSPSPLNPLGVKGVGEAGVIPGHAVLASAVEDAEGFRIDRMPISPSELFELRRRNARGEVASLRRAQGDPS